MIRENIQVAAVVSPPHTDTLVAFIERATQPHLAWGFVRHGEAFR